MLPPAPPRLSMTNGLPSSSCSPFANGRAAVSEGPPGGHGTMIVTCFVGYACAHATDATRQSVAAPSRHLSRNRPFVIRVLVRFAEARDDTAVFARCKPSRRRLPVSRLHELCSFDCRYGARVVIMLTKDKTASVEASKVQGALQYQSGFANELSTEALPGALPVGRNSPQRCPYGLYAEQLSGTAFTAPRGDNRRSWLYRIRPAVTHEPFRKIDNGHIKGAFDDVSTPPSQLRWSPLPFPDKPTDFVDGIITIAGNTACAIHIYAGTASMVDRYFYDADG